MGIVLPLIPHLVKKGASTSEKRYYQPHKWAPTSGEPMTELGSRLDEQCFDEEERWQGR